MPENRDKGPGAELRVTEEQSRQIADLLRYAVSLNTTVGTLSPTDRRLATSTYRAVELAAQVLEGKPLEEAVERSEESWTGSLQKDHEHALTLLQSTRDALRQSMTPYMTPGQLAEYLEITQEQLTELVNSTTTTDLASRPEIRDHRRTRARSRSGLSPPTGENSFTPQVARRKIEGRIRMCNLHIRATK